MKPTDLIEHPEGGHYREMFRSHSLVGAGDRGQRAALTHIYFALAASEVSRFHRVKSDEVWNLYRGSGIRLHLWDGVSSSVQAIELSAAANAFCCVVPAGVWQAAVPVDGPVLVGCTVAPGFEFEDFEMLQAGSALAKELLQHHTELADLVLE